MKSFEHYYVVARRWIIRPLLQNKRIAHFLSKHCLKVFLAMYYENWMGQRMHFRNPRDLNQALIKLSWLNSHNPEMRRLMPMCTDKYAVREYITAKGYGDTLNELYGVYDNVEDIDFDALPNQFVMKMNNASGRNYICTDKKACNWNEVKAQFATWLKDHDYAWWTGEWQYQYIEPKIVIEKYLKDLGDLSLIDYKAQVFHGKVLDFFVCYNRDNDISKSGEFRPVCYDCYVPNKRESQSWKRTEDITSNWHRDRKLIAAPKQLKRMIQMAEECSKDFPYVRFDMYEIDGKIVFGEMTFTPHGNVMDYYTDEYLKKNKDLLLA